MHTLVREMTERSGDREFLHHLLRQLSRGQTPRDHAVILDNLHRFEAFQKTIASCLAKYLCQQLCSWSRRNRTPWWRAFVTLRRMGAVHSAAIAAARVARRHPLRRFRLAARAYLEFVADVSAAEKAD